MQQRMICDYRGQYRLRVFLSRKKAKFRYGECNNGGSIVQDLFVHIFLLCANYVVENTQLIGDWDIPQRKPRTYNYQLLNLFLASRVVWAISHVP